MNTGPERAENTLSIPALERIHSVCAAFEMAWKRLEAPKIEHHLEGVSGAERQQLLRELLLLEFDYRYRGDEKPHAEEYRARFPADLGVVEAVLALANAGSEAIQVARGDTVTLPFQHAGFKPVPSATSSPYRVLDVLGEGGMGIVYLAEQTGPIRRRVALKVIKQGMDTKEVVARFESERQALALMDHPAIAKVFDAGATEDGKPFFAMEYVQGVPITEYCDRHKLTIRERIELFQQVCQGVQHAHLKGMIHRDLKPSNILVGASDERPLAKIIDFGVAKATNQRLTEKTIYTEIGRAVGTPAYMSPEQAEMTAEAVDQRTDVYSLGVILYELLVGELPLDWDALSKAAFNEILRRIREEDPPTPSTRLSRLNMERTTTLANRRKTSPAHLSADLRGDLDWITMKALEKERTRRYATAAELAADIQRHLKNDPVLAGPPSAVYRFKKYYRRHRGPVIAAAAVFAVLFAGLVATTAMYLRSETQRNAKEAALGQKDQALSERTAALAEKEAALTRADGLRLLAESTAALPEDPGLALLLGIEAARRVPTLANHALLEALGRVRERKALVGHLAYGVSSASFSPNGNRVVTASEDKTARIWDAESGKEIAALQGHNAEVRVASFSPDGKRVVTATWGKTARIWDAEGGNEIAALQGHSNGVVAAASFSPDGKRVVTASYDGTARIWDPESGKEIVALRGHDADVKTASFSPDGKRVVTASADDTARIWNAESGMEIVVLRGHDWMVQAASFSPDGNRVVTASYDGTARIWDIESGKEIVVLTGHYEVVLAASFSPDGKQVLTASYDRTARIWDTEVGNEIVALQGHSNGVPRASFSPDGKRVLTASYDKTARIWDAESGKQILVLQGYAARFSPDGKRVVTASEDKTARIWDAESGKEIVTLQGHDSALWAASFSPDGKRVVAGSGDKTARIWDPESGKDIAALRGHDAEVRAASFSPDGKRVVTASADKTARIWDTEGGNEIVVLQGHSNLVEAASFSPDGKRVVTASYDNTARIWDAESGKEIVVLTGHDNVVEAASFSPDGKRVVTASRDKTARIWDAESGKEIVALRGHDAGVETASFSPDGQRVVTASDDGTARIWPVDILGAALRRKPRELTPEEKKRFEIGTPEGR